MPVYRVKSELPAIRRHRDGDSTVLIQPNQIVRSLGEIHDGIVDLELGVLTFTVLHSDLVEHSEPVRDDLNEP